MVSSSRSTLTARRPARAASPRPGGGRTAGRRGAAKKGQARPRRRSFRRWLLKWSLVALIWGVVGGAGLLAYYAYTLPDVARLALPARRPAVTVLAADGATLARFGEFAGRAVRVDELPPHLVEAVLAVEDRRFYRHFGIDPLGLARAMLANLSAGHMVQGGSTITQQLAKNLFLTPERTLDRKIREALLALWLEATYDKDEILSAYLNRVYLGAGTYGVDAAARTYFGVPATEVTLHQAAVLAGLLRAPSRYAPTSNPDLAAARARTVLAAMVDAGYLSAEAAARTTAGPPLPPRRPAAGEGARYFADWAADQVPEFVGHDPVDLTVSTTLDPALQRQVEAAVARRLAEEGMAVGADQAAVILMAPDGSVLAMVGGRAYATSQFNRATQARRQPGSAFKPIVYLAALEHGVQPGDAVADTPVEVRGYAPGNFDGRYLGDTTVAEALARSANAATLRLLDRIGIDAALDTARRLGLAGDLRRDLSLALGTSEVTPLDLTGAYATLAAGGRAVWPYAVREIRAADGEVIYRRQGSGGGRVADPAAVATLTAMLAQVIESGTGTAARLDRPAAGKTGTSQDYRDAWFLGFTADFVCGVWVGNDDGRPMDAVTGGGLPARLWRDVMLAAHAGLPPRPLAVSAADPIGQLIAQEEGDGLQDVLRRVLGE